jgi:radical SAM superfamily enzyme YgiQ (UPF0313 family)
MLVKLIQPRMTMRPMDSIIKPRMAPSLGLLTLASLTPSEHQILIQDENVRRLTLDDSPNLVGITANVDNALRAYEIAAGYRRRGIPVIGGGIHVSAVPEEAQQHFDAICIGNAENVWAGIVADTESGALKPVYQSVAPIQGQDIPILKRNVVAAGDYLYSNTISASRGCPFKCDFCYNSCEYVNYHIINRPVDEVLREIRGLGTRHVLFIDDNLIGNPAWTWEFLTAIRDQHMALRWNAAVSVNLVNHLPLLDLMAETGCNSLFVGFETINKKALAEVGKRQNQVAMYNQLIEEIHRRGIMVNASMVFGLDHDDASMFKTTLKWLVDNKVETMTAHILTPYPGTVLYERMDSENRIIDKDYSHYNTSNVVYTPMLLTAEQLREGYSWMYKQFYSFKNIYRRMPRARQQIVPYLLFNFAYRRFGKVTALMAKIGLLGWVGQVARRLSYHVD